MSTSTPGPDADPHVFPKAAPPLRFDDGELEKLVKFYGDIQSQLFNQSVAYNNIIIAAGYAGAFALWNIVKSDIGQIASRWVVISLGISLCAFIGWNVFTMIWIAIERSTYGAATESKNGDDYIRAYRRAEADTLSRYRRRYLWTWIANLVVTIVTGLIGVAILLVHVAAKLLEIH